VLVNLVDRGLNLQEAIDAPRFRYVAGRRVMLEDEIGAPVIAGLEKLGHERVLRLRASAPRLHGRRQAILIDPKTGALLGASDQRKDGLALGY